MAINNRLLKCLADTQPRGEDQAGLCPGKNPRNGSQCGNAGDVSSATAWTGTCVSEKKASQLGPRASKLPWLKSVSHRCSGSPIQPQVLHAGSKG
jgi:hypothetical protein